MGDDRQASLSGGTEFLIARTGGDFTRAHQKGRGGKTEECGGDHDRLPTLLRFWRLGLSPFAWWRRDELRGAFQVPLLAHGGAGGFDLLVGEGKTLRDALPQPFAQLAELVAGLLGFIGHGSACLGHQGLGSFEATPNFHPGVVVAQAAFFGNLAIVETKHEMTPQVVEALGLGLR